MATTGREALPARTQVCVVGAGPAGLLLALLLAKRGAQVLVLEGHASFDREFRGEVLQPSTPRLLDAIGLLRYILDQPHLTLTEGKLLIGGLPAATFDFKAIAPEYPYALWMPQPVFLEALVRKAAPFPGFACRMGCHVSGLIEEDGAVAGVRGVRRGREGFEVRADLVVGADGRFSTLRRQAGLATAYEYHDFDVIWFVVDPPAGWPKTITFSLGAVPLILLPKYPNLIQVGLLLERGEWRRWRDAGVSEAAARLRGTSPLFSSFADRLQDFTPFHPLPALISLARDWARDGLLLIGDAAHTMSPAGAIGVNVALATAAVAAQEIYPHLGRGTVPRGVLSRVQQLREPEVRALHRIQRAAQRALLGAGSGHPLLRRIVPRLLPAALGTRFTRRLQRRLFFGAPLPPLDPEFAFKD